MKVFSRFSLGAISLALLFNILAVTEAKAQFLNEILKRMDAHQKSLSSLRSNVTMEKYNSQLRETDVIQGTAIYLRTAKNQVSVRIDWTKPSLESLAVTNTQFILHRPRLMQAIIGRFDETKENVWIGNMLSSIKMSKKDVKAKYNIKYLGQETVKGEIPVWHLVFTPKKPDLYEFSEFWVDGNGMPVQVKMLEANKDSTTVLLSDIQKNGSLNVTEFQLKLPKRTKIVKMSANACSCFKADNADDAVKYWSDTVFSGKVVAVNGADYTFKAERVWKGVVGSEIVVRSFLAENNCAISPTGGERYVVFARNVKVGSSTVLGLMPCNSTSNIVSVDGKKILKEIGKGKPLKKINVRKKRLPVKTSRKRVF